MRKGREVLEEKSIVGQIQEVIEILEDLEEIVPVSEKDVEVTRRE
jgi:hypothetical protein